MWVFVLVWNLGLARALADAHGFTLSPAEATQDFISTAAREFGQIQATALPPPNSQYLIHSSYFPARKYFRNLIILVSGQHGVEMPAGSAIQRHLLRSRFSALDRAETSYLIIHGMNPFGIENSRRFNANNVDLNRNCFSKQAKPFPGRDVTNADYASYHRIFSNFPSGTLDLLFSIGSTLGWYEVLSLRFLKSISRALTGQYQFPMGIYYGGERVEPECEIVQTLIRQADRGESNVLLFNFHTGLGSYGINQFLQTPPEGDACQPTIAKEEAFLNRVFGPETCTDVCEIHPVKVQIQDESLKSLAIQGTLTQWIYQYFGQRRQSGLVIALTSEIGTYRGDQVLLPILQENHCHWNKCSPEDMQSAKIRLREVFNPNREDWRNKVIQSADIIGSAIQPS